MKKGFALLMAVMMLTLCACSDTGSSAQTEAPAEEPAPMEQEAPAQEETPEVQYDYQLKAGELVEVSDVTFDEMVTVTVDPASTRDGSNELRSQIYFYNCAFDGGLTIVGDYHAMVSLDAGCSFGEGSTVTCKEATAGAAKETTLEDNLIKLLVSCEGVTVETQSALGVLTDGPDVVLNGTTYSKTQLAPDTAYLGVYSIYEGDTMTYLKLAIGEDDSVAFLE